MRQQKLIPETEGVAEIELIYRSKIKPNERPRIIDSRSAYEVFLKTWNKDLIELQEEFKVMMLNTAGRLMGIYPLFRGGMTATTVDPRLIYVAALETGANSVILAHNHPSGEVRPSKADEKITGEIKAGAQLLRINLNDHLIITPDTFFSFAQQGLL
jgi:DNA repair protein RadC